MERRVEMAGDAGGSAANPVELGGDDGDDEGHATGRGGEGEEEGIAAPCKEPRAPRPQGGRRQGVAGPGKKPRPLPVRASAAAAARALSGVTYHVAAIGEASEAELMQALPSYHPYP